eukprot:CAMPEP_0174879626 /NCGR_PEP_ID=MMETSP1114-20130205/83357_1 /TAXON_ID=312471 /ORGANISM="Neobodo designis, Strain CCAP 1951/1" /LENGTH=113 /DNA_ID=CAMNT_0016115021 /DNA_START=470 /DNA_END=812 /DNA_ORIENTATION=+
MPSILCVNALPVSAAGVRVLEGHPTDGEAGAAVHGLVEGGCRGERNDAFPLARSPRPALGRIRAHQIVEHAEACAARAVGQALRPVHGDGRGGGRYKVMRWFCWAKSPGIVGK